MTDYYKVLGVEKGASKADIKSAYRELVKKYHRLSKTDDIAKTKLQELNQAYVVLENDAKRESYDRYGTANFEAAQQQQQYYSESGFDGKGFETFRNSSGFDIFDMFDDLMGKNSGTNQNTWQSIRGADIKYNLSISLEEAFSGIETEISFSATSKCSGCNGFGSKSGSTKNCNNCNGRGNILTQHGFFQIKQTCPNCSGSGKIIKDLCKECSGEGRVNKHRKIKISIPKGVQHENHIKLSGEGEAGSRGGAPGNLFVVISIKQHSIFKVKDDCLYCKLPIPFSTAVLGGKVSAETIDRESIEITIPPGTQNNHRIKIAGKGMPKLRSQERGDLLVDVYVHVPQTLTKQKRAILTDLQELEQNENGGSQKSFFEKVKDIWK
jgi:molecular chaperone DnaJ